MDQDIPCAVVPPWQISNTQWRRAVEGRRGAGEVTTPGSPAAGPVDPRRDRAQTATPTKLKRENGRSTPDPTAAACGPGTGPAESPNLRFSRQKLRKSTGSYGGRRPASQTSVGSSGSSGLPPKDPEHKPRNKARVNGGTQTASCDLEEDPTSRRLQLIKSYSLTGTAAQQLSQSLRDRLLGGGGGGGDFSTMPAATGRERSPRLSRVTDGSLSDGIYGTTGLYADPRRSLLQRPSSAYTAYVGQQMAKTFRGSMTDADSVDPLVPGGPALMAHLQQQQQQRNGSPAPGQARLMGLNQWDGQLQSPRLSRSNSIRSTKSEKLYSNLLQRAGGGPGGSVEEDPYYSPLISGGGGGGREQPPSPTPSSGRASFPLSPVTGRNSYTARNNRDEDVHGSSLSLVSTTSSIYSAHEEKQASELRRLKRELLESTEKVQTLSSQLTTNAHVVEAFEQSLTSMTKKLHQLTLSSEQKDREIAELRRQSERLQRGLAAGGATAGSSLARQTSNESLSSQSSACSGQSQQSSRTPDSPGSKKLKKKGWLRSSFGKAFSRKKSRHGSDLEDFSAPSSPVLSVKQGIAEQPEKPEGQVGGPGSPGPQSPGPGERVEDDLRRQLREKDAALTDMRLEALSSHHQLETLKETVSRMRKEMASVRQDNERLQRLVMSRSANSSRSSLAAEQSEHRHSAGVSPTEEVAPGPAAARDEKALLLSVRLSKLECGGPTADGAECPIGTVTVGRRTSWEAMDEAVRKVFREYLCRLDPDQSLGIDPEAILSYRLGDATRQFQGEPPELLPWGYTVGDVRQGHLVLADTEQGCVDAFVFENLVPKPIVQRYVSILLEHRRVMLCGQGGTGKTYLARRLAEHLVRRAGLPVTSHTVAMVTVEPGGGRELHQYLSQLAERCRRQDTPAEQVPHVLVLDNLHHVPSPADVFNGFLSGPASESPYIIGTMVQTSGGATGLQLRHNFRWLQCANHLEPARGLLARQLRRRLTAAELQAPAGGGAQAEQQRVRAVFEWLPRVWQQLNRFLETHSSADVTIGPRLFLNCPCELLASQVWFTDLWNYTVAPYLVETVREGLVIYGRRASWHDPAQFVADTYPWPRGAQPGPEALTRLRPEDVGYDSAAPAGGGSPASQQRGRGDNDPLLSMLKSLQEAANSTQTPGRGGVSSVATSPEGPREPHRRAQGAAGLSTI